MKITHVRLLVTEFDACFRFYRDQLGLAVLWGGEGAGYADFRIGEGVGLALFGRSEMAASIGQGHRPVSTECQDRAMLVVHVDDLDATVDRLKSQGVQFVADVTDHPEWGIRTAHLRDPDGTLIELNSDIPRDEWPGELQAAADQWEQG